MAEPFVLVTVLVILVMSVVAHEVAHGWMAYQCGDPTALRAGRLTFNPLPHIDPMMTVVVPVILLILSQGTFAFGGAKPVPINPFLFRNSRRDWILVSAAGVVTNLLIAVALALLVRALLLTGIFAPDSQGTRALAVGMVVNIFLALFNLVPIPPLDGSRILGLLFPDTLGRIMGQLESVGFVLILIAIWFTPLVYYLKVMALFLMGVLL